jgi:hypothetical protein
LTRPGAAGLSFEERLSLLVYREACWRDERRRTRLLKLARLKYPQTAIEDLETRAGRTHSALYLRGPRLSEELRVLHYNGGFTKWLLQVARVDVLLLDNSGVAPLDAMVRNDLLKIIDDRLAGKPTIVASQLPIEH